MIAGDALWRNRPGGATGWRALLATAGAIWIAPALVGLAALGLLSLAGDAPDGAAARLWAPALALTFSPLLSWIGWAIALPAARWLLLRDRFGWFAAGATGLVAGYAAQRITGAGLAAVWGAASLLALRALLPAGPSAPGNSSGG